MIPVWYKKRAYPHFDLPMPAKDAQALATNQTKVSQHSFFPFLAFEITQRRFRSAEKGFKVDKKERPIRVAAHRDGYIFAYYAHVISALHEKKIKASKFADCVLAYRRGIQMTRKSASIWASVKAES